MLSLLDGSVQRRMFYVYVEWWAFFVRSVPQMRVLYGRCLICRWHNSMCHKSRCHKGVCHIGECNKGGRHKGRCHKGGGHIGECHKGGCHKGGCHKSKCRKTVSQVLLAAATFIGRCYKNGCHKRRCNEGGGHQGGYHKCFFKKEYGSASQVPQIEKTPGWIPLKQILNGRVPTRTLAQRHLPVMQVSSS